MNRRSTARCCLLGLVLACVTAATAATAAQAAFAPGAPALEPGAQVLRPHFELQIEAPAPLDAFLLRHAELQRLRHLPDLSRPELERLLQQAPDNLRDLLATQGYFAPTVHIDWIERGADVALVRIRVEPGTPTRVWQWQLRIEGDACTHPLADQVCQQIEAGWGLPVGQVFTQAAWSNAKAGALRLLTQRLYPRARIAHSLADIDPETHQAHLHLVLDSGAPHFFGPIEVEGALRHDAELARRLVRLAGVRPGLAYDAQRLLAAQQRLLDSGYYASAFVLLDPESADPLAQPVLVRVREVLLQQVVAGIGTSTDHGLRLSLEYTHQRLPVIGWRGVTRLLTERDTTSVGQELWAPVDERGWQWIASGLAQQQRDPGRRTDSEQLRLGRSESDLRLERSLFVQYDQSRSHDLGAAQDVTSARALSANFAWSRNNFDDPSNPRRGHGLAAELGAGVTLAAQRLPYVRARLRGQALWPLTADPHGASRLVSRWDVGAIWAATDAPIPDSQRFLAGGSHSVRGYAQREIGVARASGNGVDAGRLLVAASLEWLRPIAWGEQPRAWESALFVDAGAVADRLSDLQARIGIGAGLRFNSPVGPLQADLAYGLDNRRWNLHLSVGFTF